RGDLPGGRRCRPVALPVVNPQLTPPVPGGGGKDAPPRGPVGVPPSDNAQFCYAHTFACAGFNDNAPAVRPRPARLRQPPAAGRGCDNLRRAGGDCLCGSPVVAVGRAAPGSGWGSTPGA